MGEREPAAQLVRRPSSRCSQLDTVYVSRLDREGATRVELGQGNCSAEKSIWNFQEFQLNSNKIFCAGKRRTRSTPAGATLSRLSRLTRRPRSAGTRRPRSAGTRRPRSARGSPLTRSVALRDRADQARVQREVITAGERVKQGTAAFYARLRVFETGLAARGTNERGALTLDRVTTERRARLGFCGDQRGACVRLAEQRAAGIWLNRAALGRHVVSGVLGFRAGRPERQCNQRGQCETPRETRLPR